VLSVVVADTCPRARGTVTTSHPWAMEARGVEVAHVVEREAAEASLLERGAPAMPHRVLVGRALCPSDE